MLWLVVIWHKSGPVDWMKHCMKNWKCCLWPKITAIVTIKDLSVGRGVAALVLFFLIIEWMQVSSEQNFLLYYSIRCGRASVNWNWHTAPNQMKRICSGGFVVPKRKQSGEKHCVTEFLPMTKASCSLPIFSPHSRYEMAPR